LLFSFKELKIEAVLLTGSKIMGTKKSSSNSGQSKNTRSGKTARGSQNNSNHRATQRDSGNRGKRSAQKSASKKK